MKRITEKLLYETYKNEQCPVCGYYCLGNGGFGCIDKPTLCRIKSVSARAMRRISNHGDLNEGTEGENRSLHSQAVGETLLHAEQARPEIHHHSLGNEKH